MIPNVHTKVPVISTYTQSGKPREMTVQDRSIIDLFYTTLSTQNAKIFKFSVTEASGISRIQEYGWACPAHVGLFMQG